MLKELLELGQHRLKHTSPGVGISLDNLNDALDFAFKGVANGLHSAVKTQHTCAHAIDQTPRRVVHRGKKIGLGHSDTQHGHLQARKPHPYRRRNALFGEDALKQQRHHFDRGALFGRGRGFFQRLFAFVQFIQQHGRRDLGVTPCTAPGGQPFPQAMLDGFDGTRQAWRQGLRLGVTVEAGQMFGNQAVESAQHSLGLVSAARQGRCPCHEAGLFGNTSAMHLAHQTA